MLLKRPTSISSAWIANLVLTGHQTPAALVSLLEKSSIAKLLDGRILHAVQRLDKPRLHIEHTYSEKVLVTRDLIAGKSSGDHASGPAARYGGILRGA